MTLQSSNKTFSTKQQLEFRQLELEVEKLWEKLQNAISLESSNFVAERDHCVIWHPLQLSRYGDSPSN